MGIVNKHAYEYKGVAKGEGLVLLACHRVWVEPAGTCLTKKKDMNLSSCVADSLLLSLDSAGQTLGTGTNSPPSIIFSALSTGHVCGEA